MFLLLKLEEDTFLHAKLLPQRRIHLIFYLSCLAHSYKKNIENIFLTIFFFFDLLAKIRLRNGIQPPRG